MHNISHITAILLSPCCCGPFLGRGRYHSQRLGSVHNLREACMIPTLLVPPFFLLSMTFNVINSFLLHIAVLKPRFDFKKMMGDLQAVEKNIEKRKHSGSLSSLPPSSLTPFLLRFLLYMDFCLIFL